MYLQKYMPAYLTVAFSTHNIVARACPGWIDAIGLILIYVLSQNVVTQHPTIIFWGTGRGHRINSAS